MALPSLKKKATCQMIHIGNLNENKIALYISQYTWPTIQEEKKEKRKKKPIGKGLEGNTPRGGE